MIKIIIYHINYDVIQGSAALTKAVRTHVKEYDIFSGVFDNANQLLTNHSPFASLGQVDKWTAKPSTFSIQDSLSAELSRIMAAKTFNNFVPLTGIDVQTFLEGKENQYMKRKTQSYVFSDFGNGLCRSWERKSTTGRFVTGRFWLFTWKTSSVGK